MSPDRSVRPPTLDWLPALREPERVLAWSLDEWQRVVRIARPLRLLARLAEAITAAGLVPHLPAAPARALDGERRLSAWRVGTMHWTIERVGRALDGAAYPRLLLKGAAYVAQDLPIALGRLPSDLDILVPRAAIDDAQARLVVGGWAEMPLDEHDRRYYHEWSHEVPPMHHPLIAMELDLHHGILPPSAIHCVDDAALVASARPSRLPGWSVFDPVDQALHCAAHLFFDSELRRRARDLVDLDGLLSQGVADGGEAFWTRLLDRAQAFALGEPLALGLSFARGWIGTPVPADVVAASRRIGPGVFQTKWLSPALAALLTPHDPDCVPGHAQALAATAMLARYHLRRLPLRRLLPHLWRKWQMQRRPADAPARDAHTAAPLGFIDLSGDPR